MKKNILLLLCAVLALSSRAQPPNNAIFIGGSGDGVGLSLFSIAANNLFMGGAGDGATQTSNNNVSNLVFLGGAGDGINAASNGAVSNAIFRGSEGDGFANQTNNAVSNNIFLGSEGDGFANNTNAALSNNIFAGGEGDGWNAVILPMGPLPVKLLSFTAAHAGNEHLVKWVTTEEINTHYFEVQRSANGRDFTGAGRQSPAGGPSTGASYSLMIMEPWTGNNFYRLKIVDNDGSITYSNMVLLKEVGNLQLSVYPNPTATVLNIRLPVVSNVSTIKASIQDAQGKLVLQPVLQSGNNNAIDVEHLPAGIYTLRCSINQQLFTCRFMKNK